MRRLIFPLGVILLGLYFGGCGGGKGTTAASRSARVTSGTTMIAFGTTHQTRGLKGDEDDDEDESRTMGLNVKGDNDNDTDRDVVDNARNGYYDKDDGVVANAGRPAGPSETYNLTAVVKRYFEAAAAINGATACSLTDRQFARAIPEDYGRAPGPAYLRGAKTCAAVMSLLFGHEHQRFTQARLVTGVRLLSPSEAYVLLGSKTAPAGLVALKRSGGAWKVAGFVGSSLP